MCEALKLKPTKLFCLQKKSYIACFKLSRAEYLTIQTDSASQNAQINVVHDMRQRKPHAQTYRDAAVAVNRLMQQCSG